MATLNNAVKAARMTATRDHFAGGSLELLSAEGAVLAVFPLSAGGGSVASDTWTVGFDDSSVEGEAAAATGTNATQARMKNSSGDAHYSGFTVSHETGDGEVKMVNTSIAEGQTISLTSMTIKHG